MFVTVNAWNGAWDDEEDTFITSHSEPSMVRIHINSFVSFEPFKDPITTQTYTYAVLVTGQEFLIASDPVNLDRIIGQLKLLPPIYVNNN